VLPAKVETAFKCEGIAHSSQIPHDGVSATAVRAGNLVDCVTMATRNQVVTVSILVDGIQVKVIIRRIHGTCTSNIDPWGIQWYVALIKGNVIE